MTGWIGGYKHFPFPIIMRQLNRLKWAFACNYSQVIMNAIICLSKLSAFAVFCLNIQMKEESSIITKYERNWLYYVRMKLKFHWKRNSRFSIIFMNIGR